MKFVKIFAVAIAAIVAIVWLVLQVFSLTRENNNLEEQLSKEKYPETEPEPESHEETKPPAAEPEQQQPQQ